MPVGQLGDGVVASRRARHRVHGSGFGVPGFDRGIGNHGSRRIDDSAGDGTSVGLRKQRQNEEKRKQVRSTKNASLGPQITKVTLGLRNPFRESKSTRVYIYVELLSMP